MTELKYVLPPPDAVTIRMEAAQKLVTSKQPDAALLYIYILMHGGRISLSEAASVLGLGSRVHDAMQKLRDIGLVSHNEQPLLERADTPPSYSAEDIERSIKSGSTFGPLLNELQSILGSVLSGNEMTVFFGIYDYLGLPAEVILLLTAYCIERFEHRQGEGRRPSARFIEKEAYIWARNELYSLDAAEEYISRQYKRGGLVEDIRTVLQIKKHALSPTEEKYINAWIDMGMSLDAIELAYDRTIVNTGELSWPYMNSILKNWHSKGYKTAKEAESGEVKNPKNPRNQKNTNRQKKQDEKSNGNKPDKGELERMKKYLEKLKSDN